MTPYEQGYYRTLKLAGLLKQAATRAQKLMNIAQAGGDSISDVTQSRLMRGGFAVPDLSEFPDLPSRADVIREKRLTNRLFESAPGGRMYPSAPYLDASFPPNTPGLYGPESGFVPQAVERGMSGFDEQLQLADDLKAWAGDTSPTMTQAQLIEEMGGLAPVHKDMADSAVRGRMQTVRARREPGLGIIGPQHPLP